MKKPSIITYKNGTELRTNNRRVKVVRQDDSFYVEMASFHEEKGEDAQTGRYVHRGGYRAMTVRLSKERALELLHALTAELARELDNDKTNNNDTDTDIN
jgi:hypothetical protein